MTRLARPQASQRGAALMLVLWMIALLTALVGGFALIARTENMQGRTLMRGVVAENAARAGIEYALTRVAQTEPKKQWRADGRPYTWKYADAEIEIKMIDEDGKVDLNQADITLISNLLKAVGVEQWQAMKLGAVIVDWRDPDQLTQPAGGGEDNDYSAADLPYGAKDADFESVAELQQLLGMTPEVYKKLEPHVTVYSGRAQPDPTFASGEVLTALGKDGKNIVKQRHGWDPASGQPIPGLPGAGNALTASASGTYSIDSKARLTDGRAATLRVVVRAGGNSVPGLAYTALRWEEGASQR